MKKIFIFLFIYCLLLPQIILAAPVDCECVYYNPETREINGKDVQTITSGNCYDLADRIMEVTCPIDGEIADCKEQVECTLKPVFYETIKCECEIFSPDNTRLLSTIFPTIEKSSTETVETACNKKALELDKASNNTTKNYCKIYVTQTTKIEDEFKLQAPALNVKIPGFDKFSDPPKMMDDSGRAYFPWIGEYIRAIYNFGLTAISILAVLMIIISGIKIIFSGLGGDRKEAYKRITQAVIGLVLAWGSYSLLYMINPQLVNFKSLEVKLIQPMPIYDGLAGTEDVETKAGKCGGLSGKPQTLLTDLGLKGDYYKYSNYSTRYGPLCEVPATIKAIILHYTATPPSTQVSGIVKYWGNDQIPMNERSGASCQMILDRKGNVFQVTEKLEEKVICHGGSSGFNWNKGGIGIEIMGEHTEELLGNSTQMKAVAEMVKKIANRYGIPLTNKVDDLISGKGGVFSHQQITKCEGAANQKIDPGEEYMKKIFELMGSDYVDWTKDSRCQK